MHLPLLFNMILALDKASYQGGPGHLQCVVRRHHQEGLEKVLLGAASENQFPRYPWAHLAISPNSISG